MTIKRNGTSVLIGGLILIAIGGCSGRNPSIMPVQILRDGVLNVPDTAKTAQPVDTVPNGPAAIVVNETDNAALECCRKEIIGTWTGKTENPWTEPYDVEITFYADGNYSSHSLTKAAFNGLEEKIQFPALYYGTDKDSDLKTWDIDSVGANGEASGNLIICFDVVWTTTTNSLRNIKFGNRFRVLQFDLWDFDGHGPIHFTLERKS